MSLLVSITPIAALVVAVVLLVLGFMFIFNKQLGLQYSAHEEASLPGVMGGRYIGLAAIIIGLMVMGNIQGLVLAFAIGAGFGLLDGILVSRVGGKAFPHIIAGLISAVLSIVYWKLIPGFEG